MDTKRYPAWWGPVALIVAVALIVVMVVAKRYGAGGRFRQAIAPASVTTRSTSADAGDGTNASQADSSQRKVVMPSSTKTKAQLPDGFSYTWKNGEADDTPYLPNPCEPIQYTVSDAPDGVETAIDDTFKRVAEVNGMKFQKVTKESDLSRNVAITTYRFLFQTAEQDPKLAGDTDIYEEATESGDKDVPTLHEVKVHMLKDDYRQASSTRWVVFWMLGLSGSTNLLDFSNAGEQALKAIVRECPAHE